VKLKLATPILEFLTAKPSNVVPVERTVRTSTNVQLVRTGLIKSVDCKHGTRMDQIAPAPVTHPVAQVGIIVIHQYATKKKKLICPLNISMYILCICV
jgi:hypothetical protein